MPSEFDDIESYADSDPTPVVVDEPTVSDTPRCTVCGIELEYAGRGRKPTKCDEHKTRTSTGAKGTRTRGRAKSDVRLAQIESDLTQLGIKFGATVGKGLPVTGIVAMQRSESFARAAVRICKDHPSWLDALDKASTALPIAEIAETGAAVGCAVAVDLGRMAPEGLVLSYLGVVSAFYEVYPHGTPTDNSNGYRTHSEDRPAGFVPVGARM